MLTCVHVGGRSSFTRFYMFEFHVTIIDTWYNVYRLLLKLFFSLIYYSYFIICINRSPFLNSFFLICTVFFVQIYSKNKSNYYESWTDL